MSNVIIFGAGGTGRKLAESIMKADHKVICFLDSDPNKWGKNIFNIPIMSPEQIREMEYDYVLLGATAGMDEMEHHLLKIGVPQDRIKKTETMIVNVYARISFLKRYAAQVYEMGTSGSIAEAGVFRGEFAQYMNKYFPDRTCYLFDTFTGFESKAFAFEQEGSDAEEKHFAGTSVEIVMNRMPNPNQVKIVQGWFPDSAADISDEFVFVNLDMDLYKPTYEGLHLFYPKMKSGGVILLHDYYTNGYPGIKKAVEDFENVEGTLVKLPIGDDISIAIIKP